MSTAVPTNLRVLNLFFDLLTSERGRTKDQVRRLPGYAGLSAAAFESAFQRDKDALRRTGVVLEIRTDPAGASPERYHVSRDSFPSRGVRLTSADLALVHMAVHAWSSVSPARDQMLMAKLAAQSEEAADPGAGGVPMVLALEGAQVVADVLEAIEQRRPVGFRYTSSSGTGDRAVEPWRLVLRGRALYLWGWDLDREAPRLFRLSRIRDGVDALGEPGDAPEPGADVGDPFEDLVVEPVLLVREGTAPRVRLRTVEREVPGGPVPPGWERVLGAPDELGTWIGEVLLDARDVVVEAPASLRGAVLTRLRAGAGLHAGADGSQEGVGGHA